MLKEIWMTADIYMYVLDKSLKTFSVYYMYVIVGI